MAFVVVDEGCRVRRERRGRRKGRRVTVEGGEVIWIGLDLVLFVCCYFSELFGIDAHGHVSWELVQHSDTGTADLAIS